MRIIDWSSDVCSSDLIEDQLDLLRVLFVHVAQQVLDDPVHVERQQDSLAQGLLVEQARDHKLVRIDERLDQPDQLVDQILAPTAERLLHLPVCLARLNEHKARQAKLPGEERKSVGAGKSVKVH